MTVLEQDQVKAAGKASQLEDPLVPEEPGTAVVFYAPKNIGLRLVRQPHVKGMTPTMSSYDVMRPVRYEFGPDGSCTVRVGNDILRDGEFDHEQETNKLQDAVGWLRRHRDFNNLFFEEGREPGRPQPPDSVFLREVTKATVAQDAPRLVELLTQERETHGRPLLTGAAEGALSALGAPIPEPGDVRPAPAWTPPETEADRLARQAAELADVDKGDGGIPLDQQRPYSGPASGQVF